MRLPVIVALVLALPACGGGREDQADALNQLDRELANVDAADPARDPALKAALQDQIMVDPNLQQQSNANAIRPPNRPDAGAVASADIAARPEAAPPAGLKSAPPPKVDCPECRARNGALTLGALAERQRDQRTALCAPKVAYSAAWANRLPAAAPLYPDARVVEAAGTDEAGCALRVVTFRSSAPLQRVADWYHTRGTQAGYSSEHRADGRQHVIGGVRGRSAFLAYLRPRPDGGTEVDLIANEG
jgi:hypothetical protein